MFRSSVGPPNDPACFLTRRASLWHVVPGALHGRGQHVGRHSIARNASHAKRARARRAVPETCLCRAQL